MNIKIEVLDAVIDGKGKGSVLTVDEKSAEHLVNIGYAKKVVETTEPTAPKEPEQPKQEPKKPSTRRKKSE